MKKYYYIFIVLVLAQFASVYADDGYRLWLKYDLIEDVSLLNQYRENIQAVSFRGDSASIQIAKDELANGLAGLLGKEIPEVDNSQNDRVIMIGAIENLSPDIKADLEEKLSGKGEEGFIIHTTNSGDEKNIVITANSDVGVLHGMFYFLKLLQTHRSIDELDVASFPKMNLRMLNHWDMINGIHEYPGRLSIWDWYTLPEYIKPVYVDYARANASIGINATVINNVDADPLFLTQETLIKVAVLADLFRPYGIKIFLCPNFSAPIKIGGMDTADPQAPEVQAWWSEKVKEIYELIPDFGGFLVKANSEDEPGPGDFNKTQADGANMFAAALKPFNGIVIWRTFVYIYAPEDRSREAYDIFKPLDGKFADNVILQIKNGPLDFSPREPFSPLFGGLEKTPAMMEVDIGMGGLGKDINVGFMAPMWRETLMTDTYSKGEGSTVAKVIDGSLGNHELNGMAGVANVYRQRNWTGNLLSQSSWYTFGRLAWDYNTTSEQIADEWTRMTFSNDPAILNPIKKILMGSREHIVNYMDPLGLNMLMGWGNDHGPWVNTSEHATWNSPYYHHADSVGLGFDRTSSGSDAVHQYFPPVAEKYESLDSCPEGLLLWFHHVPWTYKLKSGRTLWDELCYHYYQGVDGVREMQRLWNSLEGKIDQEQFNNVNSLLKIQEDDAVRWRNGCVLYFQTFSKLPIPEGLETPEHDLDYYIVHDPR